MNLWDKILQHAGRRVNPHSYATWFKPTRQERAEENLLIVRVPTRLFCKRLTGTANWKCRARLQPTRLERSFNLSGKA